MTRGYTHNADQSPTLNLLHSHYTVIIHNHAGGITLINTGEVIKAEREGKKGLSDNKGILTVYTHTYNPPLCLTLVAYSEYYVVLLYVTGKVLVTCC